MKNYLTYSKLSACFYKVITCLAFTLISFQSFTQVTISFSVDMAGYPIGPGGVRIAGEFFTRNSTTITEDWEPAAEGSELTLLFGTTYGIDVEFPEASAGLSLQFQFLRDNVWSNAFGDMSEGNAGTHFNASCSVFDGYGGYNRIITIPECNASYNAVWNYCADLETIYENWYADTDGDGFGDASNFVSVCNGAPGGYVGDQTDCNDLNADAHPGASEICNGIDDNCNGLSDDGIVETISITSGGPTSFCEGNNVVMAATYTGAILQWKRNGNNIPGANESTYKAIKTGTYSCTTTSPCGTATSSEINVTVNKNPTATILAGGATTFCAGDSVILSANAGGGLSYQWLKNGLTIPDATSINYVATSAGNYKCTITKTATGCFKNSNMIAVSVPCRNGEERSENNFSIYPNPADNYFTITSGQEKIILIDIYNSLGEVVYSKQINKAANGLNEMIELNEKPGLYFVQITGEGNFSTQTIVLK